MIIFSILFVILSHLLLSYWLELKLSLNFFLIASWLHAYIDWDFRIFPSVFYYIVYCVFFFITWVSKRRIRRWLLYLLNGWWHINQVHVIFERGFISTSILSLIFTIRPGKPPVLLHLPYHFERLVII